MDDTTEKLHWAQDESLCKECSELRQLLGGEKASAEHCCQETSGVPLDDPVLLTRAVEPQQRYSPDPNNDIKVHSISSRSGQDIGK